LIRIVTKAPELPTHQTQMPEPVATGS
jgi:hypothetical protein